MSGAPQSTISTLCPGCGSDFHQSGAGNWCKDDLRNAVPVLNRIRLVAVVAKDDLNFATEIGVNRTHAVLNGDPVL
jgi:hypothetical protein